MSFPAKNKSFFLRASAGSSKKSFLKNFKGVVFLGALTGLAVLVTVIIIHELGHMGAALLFGIRVKAFMVGLGPVLWRKQVNLQKEGPTSLELRPFLIGGGVDIDENEVRALPQSKQVAIFLAGPLMNLIAGWFVVFLGVIVMFIKVDASLVQAWRIVLMAFWGASKATLLALQYSLLGLKELTVGNVSNLVGPVGFVAGAAHAGQDFWGRLALLELVNIGVGIFNLLPIPPLDGGRTVMVFLPRKAEFTLTALGTGFLLAVILLITAQDLARFVF